MTSRQSNRQTQQHETKQSDGEEDLLPVRTAMTTRNGEKALTTSVNGLSLAYTANDGTKADADSDVLTNTEKLLLELGANPTPDQVDWSKGT